jgi:hypothetical protein
MVNHEVGRVKRVFRWAVSEEMAPASVWHGLLACPGLRKGKSAAPESDPVKPFPLEHIDKAKAKMRPVARAMVDFMLLTGCRPNEEAAEPRRETPGWSTPQPAPGH